MEDPAVPPKKTSYCEVLDVAQGLEYGQHQSQLARKPRAVNVPRRNTGQRSIRYEKLDCDPAEQSQGGTSRCCALNQFNRLSLQLGRQTLTPSKCFTDPPLS